MTQQLYYEDVQEGAEIPPLVKHPSNVQLFLFSTVTRNAHRIHYDKDYAISEGHPNVLIHGPLQGAFLVQLVTDWIGKHGTLKRISYQNRARAFLGDTITCKGKVTRKHVQEGEHRVECEVWAERQTGEVCSPGTATVILPTRGGHSPETPPVQSD